MKKQEITNSSNTTIFGRNRWTPVRDLPAVVRDSRSAYKNILHWAEDADNLHGGTASMVGEQGSEDDVEELIEEAEGILNASFYVADNEDVSGELAVAPSGQPTARNSKRGRTFSK